MATIGDVLATAVKNWRDPYEREVKERASALASFLQIWDREHPNASPALRSTAEYAFKMGHLSAHQDIANRGGSITH